MDGNGILQGILYTPKLFITFKIAYYYCCLAKQGGSVKI